MVQSFTLTTTEIVAGYAAIVATFVLLWDVYKWQTAGPRLKMSAGPNFIIIGDLVPDPNKYISVRISNIGDRKTTLTNLGFEFYSAKWIGRRNVKFFIAHNPLTPNPLPFVFEAGEEWSARVIQTEELEQMARSGYLYCVVYYTDKEKPVWKRITMPPDQLSEES